MTTVVTVGSEQAAGGGTMDGLMLFLTILGILVSLGIGLVAAYYARRSVILTERGMAVQDEQLQLQKEQAAMIPRLEVSDIRFIRPEGSPEFREARDEIEEKRREDEQERAEEEERKRKSAEWEDEQNKNPFRIKIRNPYENTLHINRFDFAEVMDYGDSGRNYDGPIPNAILDFQITNNGKAAAHGISGTLKLESAHLLPLDFPYMDDRGIYGPDDGFFRVDSRTWCRFSSEI